MVVEARDFLGTISWNFVGAGLVLTCSSHFQALRNTWPALASSTLQLCSFALPAPWLSAQPGFKLPWVWRVSVATVILQAVVNLMPLRIQFRSRSRTG